MAGLTKTKTKPNPKLKLELKFGAELCKTIVLSSWILSQTDSDLLGISLCVLRGQSLQTSTDPLSSMEQ